MHRPQHDITLPSFRYLSHDRLFAIILWRTPLFMKHIYWQQLACIYLGSAWQLLQEALIGERRGAGSDCCMLLLLLFFTEVQTLSQIIPDKMDNTRVCLARNEGISFLPQFALRALSTYCSRSILCISLIWRLLRFVGIFTWSIVWAAWKRLR